MERTLPYQSRAVNIFGAEFRWRSRFIGVTYCVGAVRAMPRVRSELTSNVLPDHANMDEMQIGRRERSISLVYFGGLDQCGGDRRRIPFSRGVKPRQSGRRYPKGGALETMRTIAESGREIIGTAALLCIAVACGSVLLCCRIVEAAFPPERKQSPEGLDYRGAGPPSGAAWRIARIVACVAMLAGPAAADVPPGDSATSNITAAPGFSGAGLGKGVPLPTCVGNQVLTSDGKGLACVAATSGASAPLLTAMCEKSACAHVCSACTVAVGPFLYGISNGAAVCGCACIPASC